MRFHCDATVLETWLATTELLQSSSTIRPLSVSARKLVVDVGAYKIHSVLNTTSTLLGADMFFNSSPIRQYVLTEKFNLS